MPFSKNSLCCLRRYKQTINAIFKHHLGKSDRKSDRRLHIIQPQPDLQTICLCKEWDECSAYLMESCFLSATDCSAKIACVQRMRHSETNLRLKFVFLSTTSLSANDAFVRDFKTKKSAYLVVRRLPLTDSCLCHLDLSKHTLQCLLRRCNLQVPSHRSDAVSATLTSASTPSKASSAKAICRSQFVSLPERPGTQSITLQKR